MTEEQYDDILYALFPNEEDDHEIEEALFNIFCNE